MDSKTTKLIGRVLALLVAALFLFSASGKLMGGAEGLEMAKSIGIDPASFKMLGVIEVIAAILFVIPQTGVLGMMLLTAYMGGAIATHLQNSMPLTAPCAIMAFLWIVSAFRFPELRSRLFGMLGM
jgi:DoxX-like family